MSKDMPLHRLLQRQLERCLGDNYLVPPEWAKLLEMVDEAYRQSDVERAALESSLGLSSQELLGVKAELRAAFEAIPDLLLRIDRQGTILSVKAGTDDDLMLPSGNLRGKRIQDIFEVAAGNLFREVLNRVPALESATSFKYSIQRNDRPVYYESWFIPRPQEFIVIIRNITGRTADEFEIARLNRLYAVWSEANKAVVQSHSSDQLLAQVCRVAVDLGGFRLAWVGWHDPASRVIRPAAQAGCAVNFLNHVEVSSDATIPAGRGPAGVAFRGDHAVIIDDILRDERTTPWREQAVSHGLAGCGVFPIRMNKTVSGVFCVYADTPGQFGTKEVRLLEEVAGDVSFALDYLSAEASRQRTEHHNRQLATIVNSSDDAIISRSLDDTILTWNWGATKIYGYSEAEMVGHSMNVLVPSERLTEVVGIDARLRCGELIQPFETVRRRKDGREIQVAVTVSALHDGEGRVIGAATVARDVTAQKELAAQLMRAQRLESVGKLAAGIAHDLNNILTPIMMGLPLLRPSVADPTAQLLMDTMEASVSRGAQIIQHILMFSRGKEEAKGPFETRHLVREIAEVLEQTLPKSITIRGNFPKDLWPVEGHATQFHQVLMNLCINARDAMPQGGVLTLSGENITLEANQARQLGDAQPGRYVVWTVTDTGEGMTPEILDHIFEPFFTTKAPGKGTGLGLSTARELVRDLGGFLQVRSRPGEGSRFSVYLPASQFAEPKAATAHPMLPLGHGELVLLVDDEYSVRQMLEHVLTTHNYQVVAADCGEAALVAYRNQAEEISLLITDLNMPGMSGVELIRQLRSRNLNLKVIAISGLVDRAESGASQMDILADAFLLKPFSLEVLLTQVAAVLTEKR